MKLDLRRHQIGASMVETSLVLMLFLSLIFAVVEFSLAIFYAVRLSDATRVAARVAIVDNAVIDDISSMPCTEIDGFRQCDAVMCPHIIKEINSIVDVEPSNIHIRYQCVSTGYTQAAGYADSLHQIYNITVRLQGVKYQLIMPGILGIGAKITMPSFETSRLSEDLWSKSE